MRQTPVRPLLVTAAVAGSALLLSGCGSTSTTPVPTAAVTSSAGATASATPSATPAAFAMPKDCTSMLPQSRLDAFAHDGLVLLGGPGGRYGDTYLLEKTPEEQAGGITCIWGDEAVATSTITISVAPLSPATRARIVASLVSQNLNEGRLPGAITYSQLGDEVSSPAVLNVLRNDSWISVIEALGGEVFFAEATTIQSEVGAAVGAG